MRTIHLNDIYAGRGRLNAQGIHVSGDERFTYDVQHFTSDGQVLIDGELAYDIATSGNIFYAGNHGFTCHFEVSTTDDEAFFQSCATGGYGIVRRA